jgi:hypothetical protein
MRTEQLNQNEDPRMQAAIAEFKAMITATYPTATFALGRGEDEPEAVHLTATVDVDDPDEVVDLVIERMLTLQIEEGVPIHVIPVRTPERVAALFGTSDERRGLPRVFPAVQG